jgi:hypothetical protein
MQDLQENNFFWRFGILCRISLSISRFSAWNKKKSSGFFVRCSYCFILLSRDQLMDISFLYPYQSLMNEK